MTPSGTRVQAEERIAGLLYPLSDFYALAGAQTPRIDVLRGQDMPEPYRSLLVHENDMTPTLEQYSGGSIHLRPLSVRREPDAIYRQVVLETDDGARPIEFGAIRITLAGFSGVTRDLIAGCRLPLGAILRDHLVPHFSRPTAYFAVEPDGVIREALGLGNGPTLFGRHNVIRHASGEMLADVVEILPPLGGDRA